MLRNTLLAGVALGCMVAGSGAAAGTLSLTDAPPTSSYSSIQPFYGSINPFYGAINPFYGSINPFYGSISPFWGDINPFWGDINPFYGSIDPFYGNISAFWGPISPFNSNPFWGTVMPYWQSAGPQWGTINATWNQLQASNATDYSGLQSQLQAFLAQSSSFWSPAVQTYTGKNFDDGFANAMLAKYGIDPNDAASLASVNAQTRSAFFLNFYDGLMSFTGVDHVDWWMSSTHWSPMLSQIQGANHVVVGLLDSTVSAANADVADVQFIGGYQLYVNDHGAAVASLIAAQQDGHGVMGVAPNADINLYNPFDATGTANWNDVAQGISALYNSGAHVVNASLGVPGTTVSNEWVNILSGPLLSPRANDLVIVKAAGNEGAAQTQNVPWLLGLAPPNNLIVVGSIGPTDQISSFSNTPGQACFTILGLCAQQNKLMYHFLVAPGELDLVSDNHGGVVRMSGTSFAAPLVTGAIALLEARWPWLDQHATETAQIIFQSADDLGAPGVDPVYGWGKLDIAASQSPLNFDNLTVYQPFTFTGQQATTPLFANWSARQLKASVLNPGQLNLWQKQNAYIVAFETIGSTYRDFTIPLSSALVGKSQTVNGRSNPFQTYLYQRLIDWANGTKTSNFNEQTADLADGDWNLSMTATQSTPDDLRSGDGPFHSEFAASNRELGLSLRLGEGNGSHALTSIGGFTLGSDFDPSTGGVNPVLGFASGGAYGEASIAVARGVTVDVGFTEKSDSHTYLDPTFGPMQDLPLATAKSSASVVGFDYAVADNVKFDVSYTSLGEADGLLGAQGGGALDFTGGTKTNATTIGTSANLADNWTLSGSATLAHTSAPNSRNTLLTLSDGGLQSTAFELVAAKTGLFADLDRLRVSIAQPLHVESGSLRFSSLQVVNRDTGALGPLDETWSVSGNREYRMETIYNLPVLDGRGEVAAFGLVDVNAPETSGNGVSMSAGAQFKFDF